MIGKDRPTSLWIGCSGHKSHISNVQPAYNSEIEDLTIPLDDVHKLYRTRISRVLSISKLKFYFGK